MTKEWVQSLVARLLPLGPVEARRMFGGWGIFHEDLMFALVADGTLYIKVDEETKARFAAAESGPFVYQRPGKSIEMSYWRLPDEEGLLDWAELGLAARAAPSARSRQSALVRPNPSAFSDRLPAPMMATNDAGLKG